jgi:hypothetical protein
MAMYGLITLIFQALLEVTEITSSTKQSGKPLECNIISYSLLIGWEPKWQGGISKRLLGNEPV